MQTQTITRLLQRGVVEATTLDSYFCLVRSLTEVAIPGIYSKLYGLLIVIVLVPSHDPSDKVWRSFRFDKAYQKRARRVSVQGLFKGCGVHKGSMRRPLRCSCFLMVPSALCSFGSYGPCRPSMGSFYSNIVASYGHSLWCSLELCLFGIL